MIATHVLGLCAALVVAIFGAIALLTIEHLEDDPHHRARRRARIARRHLAQLRRNH